MKKRIISLFLALTLCVGMLPAPAWAEEPTDPTQAAGVVQDTNPSEETDPTTEPTEEETEPTEEKTEPTEEETEPTEAPKAAEVPAEETAAPGEDEAVTAVQAMIDALPDVDDMSESYLDALEAAYSAFEALSEAQQAQITGVEKLEALFNWVNSQVSTLADGVKEISGEVRWNNQTFATPVKLTGDTTLTLTGTNRIECDQPLDLNGKNLTIQGTGTLELVGKGGSYYRVGATLCDSTYTSNNIGGTLTLAGGTVKVRGSLQNAVCVYSLKLNGGKLEAYGGKNAGIACTLLQTTSGSLYATGDDYGICMYRPNYGAAVNKLTILVSNKKDADIAKMESADENAIAKAGIGDFRTVYIGEVSGPLLSVKAQKGYLYEATAKTATFALSGRNVDLSALTFEWTGSHTGLEASADGKTLTVTTDKTVQAGTYRLKVSAGGASRTVVVTVSGPPIRILTQPVDTISTDPEAGAVTVSACPTDGRTGSIDFQWKRADGTPMVGYTEDTVLLYGMDDEGMLTQDESKPWLKFIRIYCTLSYDGYSLDTDTVTLGLSSCTHPRLNHEGICDQCGQKKGGNKDALLVREDGLYYLIADAESGDANVGHFMYSGGNFYLTGDVKNRTVNVSNTDGSGKNVTLDLQGHTVKNLKMGNFPYGTFTVKNGTLGEIHTSASGKLILENIHYKETFISAQFDLTVQGENTRFELPVIFHGTTHLKGGLFEQGLDSNCVERALELLEEGFAFYNSANEVVDATDYTELVGREIHVAAHTCDYRRYGKCACGRSCDHQGTTDENGYCTVCHALVEPYAIGQTGYTSLEAALDAANIGDTITLRGDFNQGSKTVEINKSVTLELGEHTLTGDADGEPVLRVLAENVTIRNGTVENTRTAKSSPAVMVGKFDATGMMLTVKNVNFIGSITAVTPRASALSVQPSNVAKVESGTFTGGISVNGSLTLSGGKADHIYVGTGVTYASLLAKGYAYQVSGQLVKPEKMAEGIAVEVVKCGHPDGLTDTEACVYCGLTCPHSTVNAETGLCQECGSQVYEANVTAADGSVTGYRTLEEALRNGADATVKLLADCVAEETDDAFYVTVPLTLDLNGKRMEGLSGLVVQKGPTTIQDSSPAKTGTIAGTKDWEYSGVGLWVFKDANVTLTIQGGHFEGETDGLQLAGQNTLILEGGSFSSMHFIEGATATLRDSLAPGYAYYKADNTLYDPGDKQEATVELHVGAHPEHTPDSSGHCPCGYTAAATLDTDAGKQYFADFGDALEAAKAASGSTLTLLRDVTLTGDNLYINSGTFTIDWQGHTLSGEIWKGILVITEAAKVTLTDSVGTGGLRNVGGAAIAVHYGGSLTIQGGIYSPQLSKERTAYGSIQISGGRFENPKGAGRVGALFCDSGALADLLAPGYTFAYEDDDSLFYVYNVKMSEAYRSVYVVEHPTHELDDVTDTCACGFHCDHKDVGDDGVCAACGSQMAASVTAGDDGSVTYYRNIAGAIAAATASPDMVGHCDTTVTLLNDIDETISNNGMDFVLDLNGKTLAGLELKDYHFALMDSQQTGTIEQLHSDFHGYTYLKEGWCLVDADGMSLNLLTRLDTSEPIQVVHAGVVDIERSEWGTVSYGQQTIPFSLRFRLEDGLKVSSVKVSWTYEVAVREPIGSVQTLTKDEDGFYTFDTSKPLDEHPLNYGRLKAGLTYVLLSQIELELEDGQTRRIVLSGYRISTEKADLSDAVITLDSTALTYAPNPQTAVGQEQTKTVTSVTLYGNTLTEGTDYEVTGNVGTNAGTYTLTVKAKADSAFYTGSKTVTWEIKPLPIEDMMFSGQNKLYDGTANVNPLRCEYLTTKDSQLIYGIQAGADYNVVSVSDYNSPDVHDGDLLAVTVEFPGNYVGLDGTNRMELTVIGQITPAEAPAQGDVTVTVTNGNVATYTVENLDMALSDLTAPCTYGTITYGTPTVEIKDKSYTMTAVIENGALKLSVTGTGETVGQVAVVTVPVQTSNYRDFTLTVYVEAKNKTVPQVKAVGMTEICYGQKLEESRVLSSQVYEPDSETTVPGSFRWEEPETLLDAGTHPMKMIFTPEDTSKYAQTTAMVNVTVNPRPVTLSGVTVADKIYDGTAEATVKDKGTFSNAVSGDTMDYTVTAVFEDKNVAAGGEKTAYLTVTLNGDTGKNYTLAEDSQKEARARMFPKEVNITGGFTAQDRDYGPDETTVTITKGTVTFDKKAEGDDLGAQVNGGTVATPDAGQNKAVTYSATLTGEDKDNYTLGSVPDLTVTIRPIAQTLAFAEAAVTKTYGDSPFVNALTHSAGDGQITYTSSDPAVATVGTDGTVTIRGAGEARITATAAATQNYVETATSFDLTVAKATGTVKNRNYSLGYLYGDDIPTPERKYFEASSTGAFRYSWSPAAPKNAGNYQLTVTVDEDGNYTSATLVLDVLVEKDVWVRPTLVKAENETVDGKKDGKVTYTDTPALEYRLKRTRGEWIPVAVPAGEESVTVEGLAPETYEFRRPGDENHFASSPETITIQPGRKLEVTLPSPQTGYTLTADKVELSWHDTLKLTLTVAEGYYKTASLAIKAGDRVFTEDKGTYTLTNVEENLVITLEGVVKDEKAPSLALQNWIFGKGAFQGIASPKDWKNISTATAPYYVISTRGNYFAVEAWDGETGLASVSYLLSKTALTREALEQAAWEQVPEESLNQVSPDREHMIQLGLGEWYFYVKAVDKAGNVSYVGSDKLIREENAPTFSGVTKGATYYTTQKVTITDDYALSRYLPPLSGYWKDISGTSYEVTLEGNREGTYTMKVEDACQNTGTITVYMKPISALTEDIRDLTEDNVRKSDLSKLNQAEKALKGLDTTNATDEEKKEIAGALDNIGKLKTVLEEVTQVEAMIAALPERVEPWDAETEKRVLDTRSAYDAMTDHQKTMVDDSKLRTLEGQLVDYRFTSGENQTWALGCGKELRFTVNGQLAKVKEVRLNGQAVDTEKTAQAKGTDFTLRAFDLQVLGVGSYTLQVIFTDGQTPQTQVTVTVSPNYLDLSGYPDFDNEENVTVNGRTYPIGTDGGRYVNLPETGDILQRFTYLNGTYSAAHENYPTGMTAYRIIRQEGGAKLERIDGLDDLLIYSGCSIRISGKQGIRMITGITQDNKKALTGKTGLAGYTLEEYGTLICWNTDVTSGDDFSLDMSCARHNYAYLKGKADPVFARQDGKTLYTNVLVGFSLEDCAKDLILRPYIKLKDMTTGETVTLYGGSVCRSIGYIAKQNADTYKPGSSGYKYVRKIIDTVYGQEP